jgi:hypothetical protein
VIHAIEHNYSKCQIRKLALNCGFQTNGIYLFIDFINLFAIFRLASLERERDDLWRQLNDARNYIEQLKHEIEEVRNIHTTDTPQK